VRRGRSRRKKSPASGTISKSASTKKKKDIYGTGRHQLYHGTEKGMSERGKWLKKILGIGAACARHHIGGKKKKASTGSKSKTYRQQLPEKLFHDVE